MKTTTDDPKPCPFCGGTAAVTQRPSDPDDEYGRAWWTVSCDRCEAALDNGWLTKGEAVWEWNQRPVHDDLVDALREIAKGEGEYSCDPLTHAGDTIESMIEIALAALAKVEGA